MAATENDVTPQGTSETKAVANEQNKERSKKYKKFKILLSTYNETIILRKDVR